MRELSLLFPARQEPVLATREFSATPAPAVRLVRRMSLRRVWVTSTRAVAAVLVAAGLAACADAGGIVSTATMQRAESLGLTAADTASSAAVDTDWWRAFGDEQLNGLVERALASNPSLKIAQARLLRAQAAADVTRGAAGPQLRGDIDITRQRYSETGLVPPPLAGAVVTNATAQLAGSWELDFFGKNEAALDAALGTVRAAAADAQAARLLLASQVARSYFNLLRLQDQVTVAQRTLSQRQETLQLVQDRVNAGLDTRLELRQSESGLPEARLQFEMLQEQIALSRHALAALVAAPPDTVATMPVAQRDITPMRLPVSLPAELLARRADVAAARQRVEAARGSVANARAQFYPNINLIAFAGFSSIGLPQLLQAGSQQAGIGPAIRLPLFDSGRLRANLRAQSADLDAAVESYNAAVIDAVRDARDQITSAQAIARQQQEQRAAQMSAEAAYDIAVQRYRAGLGNYLSVLAAETLVLRQRGLAVDLAGRALDTQVALARALGGGYVDPAVAPEIRADKPIDAMATSTLSSKN